MCASPQEPYSESELRLIYSFDVDKDLERLSRRVALRDNCLRTLRLATKLLQICARHHLTVRETATIAVRDNFDEPSPLEHLVRPPLPPMRCNAYAAAPLDTSFGVRSCSFSVRRWGPSEGGDVCGCFACGCVIVQIRRSLEISYLALDSTSLMSTNRLGFGIMDLAELQGDPSQPAGMRRNSFEGKLKKALKKKRRGGENEAVAGKTTADGTVLCGYCGGVVAADSDDVGEVGITAESSSTGYAAGVFRAADSEDFEDRLLTRACTNVEQWSDVRVVAQSRDESLCPRRQTVGGPGVVSTVRGEEVEEGRKDPDLQEEKGLVRTRTVAPTGRSDSASTSVRYRCQCTADREGSGSTSLADSADSISDSDSSSNSMSSSSDDVSRRSWVSSDSEDASSRSASDADVALAPSAPFGSFQAPGASGAQLRSMPSAALFRYPSKQSRHRRRASRSRRRKSAAAAPAKGDEAAAAGGPAPRSESGVFGTSHTKGTVRR